MVPRSIFALFFGCWFLILSGAVWGTASLLQFASPQTTVNVSYEFQKVNEVKRVLVHFDFILAPGWHTYGRSPGDVGYPLTLKWTLPPGLSAGDIIWPVDETFRQNGYVGHGYQQKVRLSVPISGQISDEKLPIQVQASWLVCKTECLPQTATFSWTLQQAPTPSYSRSIWWFLVSAFLGGLILNIMPCVLPILSLKALSLFRLQGRQAKVYSAGYAAGILLTFLGLAILLSLFKLFGYHLGWGFQLQSRYFVFALYCFFAAMTLQLLGLFPKVTLSSTFSAQDKLPHFGYSLGESMFSGFVMTTVASACAAPFMATAVGFALLQSPLVLILVFLFLGLGFSFPFFILPWIPGALNWLPKSGSWHLWISRALAIPVALSAIWLGWLLIRLTQPSSFFLLIFSTLILLAFGYFLHHFSFRQVRNQWGIYVGLLLLLLCLQWLWPFQDRTPNHFRGIETRPAFNLAQLQTKLANRDHTMLVKVSADWCVTCKINDRFIFKNPDIQRFLSKQRIEVIAVDWTHPNADIQAYLAENGRQSLPFYMVYPLHGSPYLLPQVLTPKLIYSLK